MAEDAASSPVSPGAGWPRRVLVVARWYPSHDSPSGGSFVADQVAALRDLGVDVVVASFEQATVRGAGSGGAASAAEEAWSAALGDAGAATVPVSWGARVPVARLPAVRAAGDVLAGPLIDAHARPLATFADALAARAPLDLLIAHVGIPDGAAAARVAEAMGLPLLVVEHSSTAVRDLAEAATREAYRALAGRGRRLAAVSQVLAGSLEAALGVAAGTVAVLPNLLPLAAFPPGTDAQRDPDELLWVGARRETKGMAVLLEATALARRERPDLHLRLVGAAPDPTTEVRWTALARDLGLGEVVAFEGPRDRAGVAEAMRRAGIFVHPSPYETFGIVAAEALASGLPVAARRSGGVEEILAGVGAGAELADPDTPEGLAAAILRLRDRLDGLDRAALRAGVAARYAPERVAAAIVELGRQAAGGVAMVRSAVPVGAAAPAPSAVVPLPARIVVVGMRRPWAARRVATLSEALARRIEVVTEVDAPDRPVTLPPAGRWVEVDPDSEYARRLAALGGPPSSSAARRAVTRLLHPWRAQARRRLLEERPELRLRAVRAAIQAVVDEAGPGGSAPGGTSRVLLVALDAEDVVASSDALGTGAILAPGSLRWLADAWDAAGVA